MQSTRTPRVQITLSPATRAIFARLAAAQARPEATIISEFLDETAPALANVVKVVERAKNIVSTVGREERDRYAIAEAQLLQHAHTALSALAGADATMMQLGLHLGDSASLHGSDAGADGAGSYAARSDPPDTNRGVNTKRRSNGTGSKT